ncbi:MAG: HIT domain-containing protein [Dehalococcoidales bacterium]|jgi:ATP adenylyltransferase|nr:HIT domain-containing protein [Dehalococcoidales bacterium]MDD3994358.1 HIT domain-containing protein [Dehalococcoidales bacterium]NLT27968.1 HIT domain-containing protein [Dehalococcoidales bacterium]
MENLWAPWRMEYIKKVDKEGCIFCQKPLENNDSENYILHREKHNFVILNCYPYNPGHLMVVPFKHLSTPEDLTAEELLEHYELVRKCITTLKKVSTPDGFNVGMNLGRVAGAGIDKHIHTHIVPRWNGDNNFMPVLADIRVVNESLPATYKKLAECF